MFFRKGYSTVTLTLSPDDRKELKGKGLGDSSLAAQNDKIGFGGF
jgi:hypothetical protein